MIVDSKFRSLVSDVREHISYLQELGLERLAYDGGGTPDVPTEKAKTEIFPSAAETKAEPAAASRMAPKAMPPSRIRQLPKLSERAPAKISPSLSVAEQAASDAEVPIANADGGLFDEHPPIDAHETIDDIRLDIGNCVRCPLHQGRTKIVHTTGNFDADLMFVGEAPGADEDASGEPFVGRAGKLLTQIIEAIGYQRDNVAIGNINRCRPPQNRQPTLVEAHTCRPFLLREIAVIKPKVIVVLGNTALHNLLDTKVGISKMRGQFHDYLGLKVMPTFHPAYLLRDPSKKREVWEDMKLVRDYLAKTQ